MASRSLATPGRRVRVPSYCGIDESCSDMLDMMDADLPVPLDVPGDVPFRPRMTDVKAVNFLRAMLKCAPIFGRSYVVRSVLATQGDEARLQRLAGVWFNRIIFLAKALYIPARPPDQAEAVYVSPYNDMRMEAFRNKLRERDGWATTITRQPDAQRPDGQKLKKGVTTTAIHIVPRITSLRVNKDEAYSWELLGHLSGIDPRELVGENAHRLANGLLGDADERSLFNMFAWYLEPELDVNQAPIPDHYIFRRLLNVKGNIEQDKTPVQLRDLSQAAQDAAAGSNGTAQKREEALLPDARYLALHAAIGGVLVKSGAVFYVIRLFEELKKVRTFASDGSSNVVHLLASHSIGKLFTV